MATSESILFLGSSPCSMAQHLTTLEGINDNGTWLTIGSFDGVHIGHQQLISELNDKAHKAGSKAVVLTFHPHPTVILRGRTDAFYLTTISEKVSLLDRLGVDIVITHPFTQELSQSSARNFTAYLSDHLGFQQLWVGKDFALGKGREGDVDYLKTLEEDYHFQMRVVEPITSGGRVISSSLIRNLLSEGKVEHASSLLGRFYRIKGVVVHGDGRGKTIGIPTANLETGNEKLVPGSGVYACRAQIGDKYWHAAVNIGVRPTFVNMDKKAHVEAHILDYSTDIYSQEIAIEFVSKLRGEKRFTSVDELIEQIKTDIKNTRKIIAETVKD